MSKERESVEDGRERELSEGFVDFILFVCGDGGFLRLLTCFFVFFRLNGVVLGRRRCWCFCRCWCGGCWGCSDCYWFLFLFLNKDERDVDGLDWNTHLFVLGRFCVLWIKQLQLMGEY